MVQRSLRMEKLLSKGESPSEAKEANISAQAAARITLMKRIQELRNDLKATANNGTAKADRSHPKSGSEAKAVNKALVEHRNAPEKNNKQTSNGTQMRQRHQLVASSLTRDKDGKLRMRMLVSQQRRAAAASNDVRSGVQTRAALPYGETSSEQTSEDHLFYGDDSAEASNDDDNDKDKPCCDDLCCTNCFLS